MLVFDDLHLVTERRCYAAINYLAERLPVGCQLALATRTDPPLPLASWRAHGRLLELRAAELALEHAEARAVLAAAQVHLTEDLVAKLVERTEGWPAALYLAALSLRDRPHPEHFVDRFAGTSRHVADFLSEDVLGRQPQEVNTFLLRTCVLDELTPSLCDELTGDTDAAIKLRQIERSNLFVVPVDEEQLIYRYHHLFAQYLRAELARQAPDLVPELHRRAWRWYRDHGLSGRAVAHAQASGDVDVAAELLGVQSAAHIEETEVMLAEHHDAGVLPDLYAEAVRRGRAARALSDAELRVLRLLASDLSLSEIGRELFLSTNTVRSHRRAIYRKLGVSSRVDAVKAAGTTALQS
ncbi:MAG TPA: LuxR C-terminal-related transcriptional regulator [Steroidobacter sp.]